MIYVRSALKSKQYLQKLSPVLFPHYILFSLYSIKVDCDSDLWRVFCQQRPPQMSRRPRRGNVGASGPCPGGRGDASPAWLLSATAKGAVCAASAHSEAAADMGPAAASWPFPQNLC